MTEKLVNCIIFMQFVNMQKVLIGCKLRVLKEILIACDLIKGECRLTTPCLVEITGIFNSRNGTKISYYLGFYKESARLVLRMLTLETKARERESLFQKPIWHRLINSKQFFSLLCSDMASLIPSRNFKIWNGDFEDLSTSQIQDPVHRVQDYGGYCSSSLGLFSSLYTADLQNHICYEATHMYKTTPNII